MRTDHGILVFIVAYVQTHFFSKTQNTKTIQNRILCTNDSTNGLSSLYNVVQSHCAETTCPEKSASAVSTLFLVSHYSGDLQHGFHGRFWFGERWSLGFSSSAFSCQGE
jgi:hypothetical protein